MSLPNDWQERTRLLIKPALEYKHRLVSSMGAGGKWDPQSIRIGDFAHTRQCNLARLLRLGGHSCTGGPGSFA